MKQINYDIQETAVVGYIKLCRVREYFINNRVYGSYLIDEAIEKCIDQMTTLQLVSAQEIM